MKRILLALTMLLALLCTGACGVSAATVSYDVSTGDTIRVTLKSSDGWNMDMQYPPTFTKDNVTASSMFIDSEATLSNLEMFPEVSAERVNDYNCYFIEDATQYGCIITLSDNTSFLILTESMDDLRQLVESLTFTVS